jgi:hypothetical protein
VKVLAVAAAVAAAFAVVLSRTPERHYEAVAVIGVEETGAAGDSNAPLLPTGELGRSTVLKRTARRLRLSDSLVASSITVEDSESDSPSFLDDLNRPRELRVRSSATSRDRALELARTFAEEYVGYRREVLEEEGLTAIASMRATADVLRISGQQPDETALNRRAEKLSIALTLDSGRLAAPRLSREIATDSGSPIERNAIVGAVLGATLGLLVLQLRKPVPRLKI